MEEIPRRPLVWLVAIAAAIAAFLYVAVYDVARVHRRGPSLSGEELLILARHGAIERGVTVSCEDRGEIITGSVVALPGELAVASAGGIHVAGKAQSRFGAPLERLAAVKPLSVEEGGAPNVQVAADPGEILVSQAGAVNDSPAPRPVRAAKCMPVVRRVRISSLLAGSSGP